MKIVKQPLIVGPSAKRSEADRHRAYRCEKGEAYRSRNRDRMRKSRAESLPEFIGVDSEGIGRGKNHHCVLLGVGDQQYVAKDLTTGLHWQEVFTFLYSQYEAHPKASFVGFYLSYDFNEWLKTLPEKAAYMLLSQYGKRERKRRDNKGQHYFPVRCDGWEFDMLGFKRLSIRPWCGHSGLWRRHCRKHHRRRNHAAGADRRRRARGRSRSREAESRLHQPVAASSPSAFAARSTSSPARSNPPARKSASPPPISARATRTCRNAPRMRSKPPPAPAATSPRWRKPRAACSA